MAIGALPRVLAMRYVQPLREGGSLPAVVETDDGLYVVKFRGAGQGPRALVAEVLVWLIAEVLGLPVPPLALVDLPPPFGRSEPDPEIQDLLRGSHGLNVGLRYLDGAFNFDATAAGDVITPEFAARLVWLDALVTNPDRTHRNPNLLVWNRRPWLIDHGAALYIHHDWPSATAERVRSPFQLIAGHVLLARSDGLEHVDADLAAVLAGDKLRAIVDLVPDGLLTAPELEREGGPPMHRARYYEYLTARLEAPRAFHSAAVKAREALRRSIPRARSARR
ncbi:MAG TPA: HipA family kinase [Gemmatimonadales bacterium]|nr:HipA family kinase [Gemmatimonadales bacterium]